MCIYIYIYIHTHVYTYICIYSGAGSKAGSGVLLYVYVYVYVYAYVYVYVFRGKPNNDTRESDDDRKIQNQSFAPANRGPKGQLQHTTKRVSGALRD